MTTLPNPKKIAILGGGTNSYISNHLALSAPAYGTTARQLYTKFLDHTENKMEVNLYLTDMCVRGRDNQDPSRGSLDTPADVEALVDKLVADPDTRVIIFNIAMVDFKPNAVFDLFNYEDTALNLTEFGKYKARIESRAVKGKAFIQILPYEKIINKIRKERKDILLVGFKTTCGASKEEMFTKGLKLCKESSANIVFVNDVDKDRIEKLEEAIKARTSPAIRREKFEPYINVFPDPHTPAQYNTLAKAIRARGIENVEKTINTLQNNALVTPEESSYWYDTRTQALDALVDMVLQRSNLHFTRSTVINSETVSWNSPEVPDSLRKVVDYCIVQDAYKPFNKTTCGHFAVKLDSNTFLTSIRKTNFNELNKIGLVKVITDDPDNIYGYYGHFNTTHTNGLIDFINKVLAYVDNEHSFEGNFYCDSEYYRYLLKNYPNYNWNLIQSYVTVKDLLKNKVIAFGAKPSVGGQTQRSIFDVYPELDCIVHFHCPLKTEHKSSFSTKFQFGAECGSFGPNSCAENTIQGLTKYFLENGQSVWAVHLDHHGPNIVFEKNTDSDALIKFIATYWDLSKKTTGLSLELT